MHLPASERSIARNQRWNVCDTIFFNLLVVKPPCNSTGMTERMVSMENFEPVEITLRRLRELTETQVVDMDAHEAAVIPPNSPCRLPGSPTSKSWGK